MCLQRNEAIASMPEPPPAPQGPAARIDNVWAVIDLAQITEIGARSKFGMTPVSFGWACFSGSQHQTNKTKRNQPPVHLFSCEGYENGE